VRRSLRKPKKLRALGVLEVRLSRLQRRGVSRVRSQHLHEGGDFPQVCQGIAAIWFFGTAGKINIEKILPWPPVQRTGFDFVQVNIAQSESAQGTEQSARYILQREYERGFVCTQGWGLRLPQDKKPCEIFRVVLNTLLQDLHAIDPGRKFARNGRSIQQLFFLDLFHAARRVVGRNDLYVFQFGGISLALHQCLRVREDHSNRLQRGSRMPYEIMLDAQIQLADDPEPMLEQQIIILMNAAGLRVLNGNDAGIRLTGFDSLENQIERLTWQQFNGIAEETSSSNFAVGPTLALQDPGPMLVAYERQSNI